MSERIIPILTGADSRLTTTFTLYDSTYSWQGFDNTDATAFNAPNAVAGDIVWLGDTSYLLQTFQILQQAGGGVPERLPAGLIIYGSNDSGAGWTQIYSASAAGDETERAITGSTYYKCFKISISSASGGSRISFREMILKGTPASTDTGFLLTLFNGAIQGIKGAAKSAITYFDGSKWAVKEAGTTGQVLSIDSSGDLAWVPGGKGITVAAQAPAAPEDNDVWIDVDDISTEIINLLTGVTYGTIVPEATYPITNCSFNYIPSDGTTPYSTFDAPVMIRTINTLNSAASYVGFATAAIVEGTTPQWGCWYRISDFTAMVPNTVTFGTVIIFKDSGSPNLDTQPLTVTDMQTIGATYSTSAGGITVTHTVLTIVNGWAYVKVTVSGVPAGTTATEFYTKFMGSQTVSTKMDRIGMTCINSPYAIIPQSIYPEVAGVYRASTQYTARNWFAFGDSRTDPGYSWWVATATAIMGCNTNNYGSSGANSGRLVGEMTTIKNREAYSPTYTPDYTACDLVTIEIGSNADSSLGSMASLPQSTYTVADLPFTYNSTTISTEAQYWALFNNDTYGNIALCIEWVKWKNLSTKVVLISPPFPTAGLATLLKALSAYYCVPLIDAAANTGISAQYLSRYTRDGLHLTQQADEIWGKYVAYQLLAM